ncbi:hypothetical protein O6H91_01G002200 [Diphasiastrum complanatum]|uniref:Uncharacterized protein n=1 Tax=Diphasiastrum complanatum TaxID=34168 RepID=A0ACC2EMF3_DIPCM|nr:hypothetical protein O6H91_01G002200 [Diphasiastrum complanatum]
MASGRRKLDQVHSLPSDWSRSDSISLELVPYTSSVSIRISGQNEQHNQAASLPPDLDKQLVPPDKKTHATQNEHLLKSGALGKCDDPYCTTCPGYFGYDGDKSSTKSRNKVYGGATRNLSSWWKITWFPGILNPHTKLVHRWNQIFAISCLVAIFIDPLFLLIFSVRQGSFCIVFDSKFATVITIWRTSTDFVYMLHMLLQFRLAYAVPVSQTAGSGQLIDDPKVIAWRYLKRWFLIDLVAVLPLPQIMIWLVVPTLTKHHEQANYTKNLLRVTVLLQYIPRMIRFLPLLFGRSQHGFIFETAWANFTINLFMYLLAGHVVGSSWYLFGLQRVNACLRQTCNNEKNTCDPNYLDCGDGKVISSISSDNLRSKWIESSNASNDCLVNATFAYGIYASAVPVTLEKGALKKYIYSLFWGFLQISTLAGNVVPSTFPGEVLFTIGVIGLGLLLFALLIGNMQNFLQSLGRRQLEMQLRRYDMEAWMRRRGLPVNLRKRVRQAGRFHWAANRGVNEESILNNLPEDLHKEIRRYLFFDLIKKVHIFTVMDEEVLDAILERFRQKLYIEGSEIFIRGGLVDRMIFIFRGNLESTGADGSTSPLCGGDFCGEELLVWCLEQTAMKPKTRYRRQAVSSSTVRCLGSVEAFSLEAEDLEYVTTYYNRAMRSPRVQGAIRYRSSYFRSWAAGYIQAVWRYQKRKRAMHDSSNGRLSSLDQKRTITYTK